MIKLKKDIWKTAKLGEVCEINMGKLHQEIILLISEKAILGCLLQILKAISIYQNPKKK